MEQVARRLGLHVKTVRSYVRDGRLKASRVGRRYLISREDLAAFTGRPAAPELRRSAEASSIVQVEGVARPEMDRMSTMLISLLTDGPHGVRVELAYDESRARLKIIILGDLETSAQLLRVIDALTKE